MTGFTSLFALCAHAADYIQSENTAPASVEDLPTPLDAALDKPKEEVTKVLLDDLKRRLEKQPAWLRDLSFNYNLRTYYYDRENRDDGRNEALTLGGELALTTGTFAQIARVSLSYFVSYGIDAPEDRGGSGLLGAESRKPGRSGSGVPGAW